MSKARRVSKILDGELKTDAVGLKTPTREAPPAGLENQSDANIYLAERVDALETPEGLPDHTHEYADKHHDHPKEDYEHDHDADYAQRVHKHDSDYAAEGHNHDQKYELLTHATNEHKRLDEKIDDHAGNEHRFLPIAGGNMDASAKITWPSNTGVIDGLDEARSPQSPVRKKEFDAAVLGTDSNLEKIEANTAAIEKEVQDRKDADALKADADHTHDADTAPHTHDEYQPKGDYAAGTHTHDPQDLTHDHDGTYAADDHTHPPQDLTHDHDGTYAPVHEHPYAADDHNHDAEYIHEHPYAADDHDHDEFGALDEKIKAEGAKNAEQDGRLDALEAGVDDIATSGFDNAYSLGDPENEGEYSEGVSTFAGWAKNGNIYDHMYATSEADAIWRFKKENPVPGEEYGGKTEEELCDPKGLTFERWIAQVHDNSGDYYHVDYAAYGIPDYTFNKVDANGKDFVGPTIDEPWLVTCDDGPIQRFKGATASDLSDNKVAVTLSDGDAFSGSVKLGVDDPIPEHGHDEYATKSDLESLEAELELLAKTLESGQWKVIATAAPRPGEMWFAFDQFNAQQNQIVLNNEDISGKTHGWSALHEGDYVELIDKTDQQSRNIDHDYALYLVTKVEKNNGTVTIDLDLYQGQGEAATDEVFEVRVIDIAESELDMGALDARYIKKGGSNYLDENQKWQLLSKHKDAGPYVVQKIEDNQQYLYRLPEPISNTQAANKRYVDTEVGKKADSGHTHSGLGGSVEAKHGSSTTWESFHGTYGCDKWFAQYRRSDGSKAEATYSKKLSELGEVKFKCNSSGLENKFGRAGVLIGSRSSDPNAYPLVVMTIWKTTQAVVSGYQNMTFEGTAVWVADPNMTLQNVPNLYWTWVGDAK